MKSDYLLLNTRDELLRFDIHKIVYIEGDGNYTHIVQKNKQKASICINLSKMQQVLSDNLKEKATTFIRVGKRFIVNMEFIYQINVPLQKLTLTDGEHFAFQMGVSKEALRQLKDMMATLPLRDKAKHNISQND